MADPSYWKKNFRHFRLIMYGLILCYIWVQYEFGSGNRSYSNGQPKISGQHVNGKDQGVWTWFYPNGKKQMQGEFQNGKRIGTWIIWDSSGNKLSESHYEDDKLNGSFIRWHSNGKKESEGVYQNDRLLNIVHYSPDGGKPE